MATIKKSKKIKIAKGEKLKTYELEFLLAKHFDYRRNLIVPNVSWGWTSHECDLVVVRPSGKVLEIEIKVSKQDLLKDLEKPHKHKSKNIHEVWFAFPEELLETAKSSLDSKFGLLYIKDCGNGNFLVKTARKAKCNNSIPLATDKDTEKLKRLLCMRIWGLKKKIYELKAEK